MDRAREWGPPCKYCGELPGPALKPKVGDSVSFIPPYRTGHKGIVVEVREPLWKVFDTTYGTSDWHDLVYLGLDVVYCGTDPIIEEIIKAAWRDGDFKLWNEAIT